MNLYLRTKTVSNGPADPLLRPVLKTDLRLLIHLQRSHEPVRSAAARNIDVHGQNAGNATFQIEHVRRGCIELRLLDFARLILEPAVVTFYARQATSSNGYSFGNSPKF